MPLGIGEDALTAPLDEDRGSDDRFALGVLDSPCEGASLLGLCLDSWSLCFRSAGLTGGESR